MLKSKPLIKPKAVRRCLTRNMPQIMTGIGIAGMVTTVVLAVKATPKAIALLEEEKKKQNKELTKTEIVKSTWKCYISPAILGTFSVACIVGGQHASLKRNAALATAYSMSEAAFKEYRDKNIELFGEKKDKEIYGKIAEDKVAQNPPTSKTVVKTKKGNSLCYDRLSDRYFYSSIDHIQKVENRLNKRLISEMYISLNDFYSEMELDDLKPIDPCVGEGVGWNIEEDVINIDFTSTVVPSGEYEGEPCIVLNFHIAPRNDYMSKYR